MSLFDLSGKTGLITGAAGGLGKRFVEVLVSAGARVILTDIQTDKCKAIRDEFQNTKVAELDVTNKSAVQALFNQLEQENERIDILICSAGIAGSTPIFISDTPDDTFERIIQTNLVGLWFVMQCAANHMKKYKIAGSIIPIASVRGMNYTRETSAAYCASKAGVIQLTKALTGELARFNIRINCIAPGAFRTPFIAEKLKKPGMQQKIEAPIPLGFIAEPKELDGAVLYLASNQASHYVTGSCLTVDGGVSWGGYADV
jgi:NAD(P)-dependent dehydrogenase (short-subunit alcohol dehydrogenase family)